MNNLPTSGRHTWAELLDLVTDLRRLAYDRSLAPDDAMRRPRQVPRLRLPGDR
jgi:hypothetical protein